MRVLIISDKFPSSMDQPEVVKDMYAAANFFHETIDRDRLMNEVARFKDKGHCYSAIVEEVMKYKYLLHPWSQNTVVFFEDDGSVLFTVHGSEIAAV